MALATPNALCWAGQESGELNGTGSQWRTFNQTHRHYRPWSLNLPCLRALRQLRTLRRIQGEIRHNSLRSVPPRRDTYSGFSLSPAPL